MTEEVLMRSNAKTFMPCDLIHWIKFYAVQLTKSSIWFDKDKQSLYRAFILILAEELNSRD